MKFISILSLLLTIGFSANAQAFSGPEAVEYDSLYDRWLVGNKNNGTVLQFSPGSGTLTPFCSGVSGGPYGIEILDSVLYCCGGGSIRGFHLATGTQVFNVNLGATFLNGICSDGVSNLFVTDYSAKKIYRVNVLTSTFNVMVTGLVKSPNGIIYDGANNRCVFVNWGSSAPIMAMSLADSSTSTLVTTTLTNIDGISRDPAGNWYVSAWGNSALNRFAPDFSGGSTVVKTGLSSPADLDINAAGDSIGIPNSGNANNVVFYHICTATSLIADYTFSANGPSVQFTNTTTGGTPSSYAWDFGDGGNSTQQNPSHTFSGAGTFYVCLVVSDVCGSDTTCDSVTVTATGIDQAIENQFSIIQYESEIEVNSNYSGEVTFRLFDLNGRVLLSEKILPRDKEIISLSERAHGVYLFGIENKNHELLKQGKLILD